MRIGVRWLFAVHRYAGIALCLLMLMWCLSGIVMMYVPYPSLPEPARLAGLAPLDWRKCCVLPAGGPSSDFSVEMMHGRMLLRGGSASIDLSMGKPIAAISQADARAVAEGFARGNSIAAGQPAFETIEKDQWTVSGEFRPDRPLYRVSLGDAAGTQIYVSGASGRVVQGVMAAQRFWNYLGAVPHWLYFTQLRAQPALWTQTVIWTSLAGSLLVAIGLYLSIRQWWLARRTGRWSPYRDFTLWHHLPGLVFGLFLLSWIVSGLLSMNPWGLLEGDSGEAEAAALSGAPVPLAEIGRALHAISQAPVDATVVSLASAPLDGHLYFVATRKDGSRLRLDSAGRPAPLTPAEIAAIARATVHDATAPPARLAEGDDYYFAHGGEAPGLPVWRLIAPDGDRYYVDPVSGMLIAKLGSADRFYRWLFQGLHRLDFTAALRARPVWDIVMLALLLGASSIAATGTYLSLRYLGARAVHTIPPTSRRS